MEKTDDRIKKIKKNRQKRKEKTEKNTKYEKGIIGREREKKMKRDAPAQEGDGTCKDNSLRDLCLGFCLCSASVLNRTRHVDRERNLLLHVFTSWCMLWCCGVSCGECCVSCGVCCGVMWCICVMWCMVRCVMWCICVMWFMLRCDMWCML